MLYTGIDRLQNVRQGIIFGLVALYRIMHVHHSQLKKHELWNYYDADGHHETALFIKAPLAITATLSSL